MPALISNGVVLDSDSEHEDAHPNISIPTRNSAAAAAAAVELLPSTLHDGDDESGSETSGNVAKPKRGRKPKPKLPSITPPGADEAHGKQKRFTWSSYPTELDFLERGLDDILGTADGKQRRQKKKTLKKEFMEKFGPLGECSREQFDHVLNNWLKNHLQFPNLRKGSKTADATGDSSANHSTSNAPAQPTATSPTASHDLAPLLQSLRRRARGPSGLWAIENAKAVKELHLALGGTIGNYKTAVYRLYTGLSAEEKAFWEEKAADAKEEISLDEKQCFKNQTDFALLIANLIAAFFGYQPDQVGSGLAHIRIALRNEDGGIDHDQYTIGLHDGAPSFDIYAGGPKQDEIDRWAQFVDDFLPMNPARRDARLTYEGDGLPKLPTYSDEWTVAEARSALDAWFNAMWAYATERGTDLPHGLDWNNFRTAVAPHLPPHWSDRISSRPSDGAFHRVLMLYNDIFEAQDMPHAFRWISSTASTEGPIIPKDAPPQTPSRRMHTVYTTPTKSVAPLRDQELHARPLPRLAIPSLETIRDEDDVIDPSIVGPVFLDPAPHLDDSIGGGATVGSLEGPTVAVVKRADGNIDPVAAARDTSIADSAGLAMTTTADLRVTPGDPATTALGDLPAMPANLTVTTATPGDPAMTTPGDVPAMTMPAHLPAMCADTTTMTPADLPTTPAEPAVLLANPAAPPADLATMTLAEPTTARADPATACGEHATARAKPAVPCADPDPVAPHAELAAACAEPNTLCTELNAPCAEPAAPCADPDPVAPHAEPATPGAGLPTTKLAEPATLPADPAMASTGSKRKRQGQPSQQTVKRPKAAMNDASRNVRPKPVAPTGTPRKTRSRARREAQEAATGA